MINELEKGSEQQGYIFFNFKEKKIFFGVTPNIKIHLQKHPKKTPKNTPKKTPKVNTQLGCTLGLQLFLKLIFSENPCVLNGKIVLFSF